MAIWKELFADSAVNTALVAAATEQFISANSPFQSYNKLEVSNQGTVSIDIHLDGMVDGGRIFPVQAGATRGIEPDDGIWFRFVEQQNMDAALAEVAGKIRFRWARCAKIGE